MNKRPGSIFDYADVDSKRLQEAFFSTASKKKPGKKKIIFILIPACLLILISYFVLSFELVFIPKSSQGSLSDPDLIQTNQFSSIILLNTNKDLIKRSKSSIYLAIPEEEKTGIVFNFNKEQNLRSKNLNFWIKNATAPLSLDVILKDANFFSNARMPIKIDIDSASSAEFIKVPIPIDSGQMTKVNLSRIKQIKVYFKRPNLETESIKIITRDWRRKWLIIKDITLSKKAYYKN